MTRASADARADILHAIRSNLAASAPHDRLVHSPAPEPARHRLSLPIHTGGADAPLPLIDAELAGPERFRRRLEAVGGVCDIVADRGEAARAIARALEAAGVRHLAASDAPLVSELLRDVDSVRVLHVDELTREELFACDAGITTAQWGIAETGTLVLESAGERNRLLSLVPPVHIAVLSSRNLVETLGEVLARLRGAAGRKEEREGEGGASNVDPWSRAITFITGPSRTSDIELTLTIGVHGPQRLHVILIDQ